MSLWNTSDNTWSFVYEWIVVIEPCTMPKLSFNTLAIGARQLVVHDALQIMVSVDFNTLLFTPNTTVASTSVPGAEMMTFFAPAAKCKPAFSLLVNMPVHSYTTSTFNSPHGNFAGSRSAVMRMASPLTNIVSPSNFTVPLNTPCTESYLVR